MRQSLGKHPLQIAILCPLAQQGMGEVTQERYGSLLSLRGSLERPEWSLPSSEQALQASQHPRAPSVLTPG
ncbi:mCG1034307 [Mus musculus]|nr:mCG1034307 [Mus musculus]